MSMRLPMHCSPVRRATTAQLALPACRIQAGILEWIWSLPVSQPWPRSFADLKDSSSRLRPAGIECALSSIACEGIHELPSLVRRSSGCPGLVAGIVGAGALCTRCADRADCANCTRWADCADRARRGDGAEVVTYNACIRKYVDDTKALATAAQAAGNSAVDEFNKFAAEIRAEVEAK